MHTYLLTRPAATFIVRLWIEPTAARAETWRGEVMHVQSGEKHYFTKVEEIERFVKNHLVDEDQSARRSAASGHPSSSSTGPTTPS